MIRFKIEPTPSHYNLVLRALRQDNEIEKMLRMAMSIIQKGDSKINGNTFEIIIEALLEAQMWKQTLAMLNIMEKFGFKPQIQVRPMCQYMFIQSQCSRLYLLCYNVTVGLCLVNRATRKGSAVQSRPCALQSHGTGWVRLLREFCPQRYEANLTFLIAYPILND